MHQLLICWGRKTSLVFLSELLITSSSNSHGSWPSSSFSAASFLLDRGAALTVVCSRTHPGSGAFLAIFCAWRHSTCATDSSLPSSFGRPTMIYLREFSQKTLCEDLGLVPLKTRISGHFMNSVRAVRSCSGRASAAWWRQPQGIPRRQLGQSL